MGDRDPFGRDKDENPLAHLGWDSEASSSVPDAEPEPSTSDRLVQPDWAPPAAGSEARATWSAPPPDATPQSTWQPAGQRPPQPNDHRGRSQSGSGSGVGRLVRGLVILCVLVAILVSALGTLVSSGGEQLDRFVRSFTTPAVPTVPDAPLQAGTGRDAVAGRSPATPPRGVGRGSLLRPYAFGRAITRLRSGGHGRLSNLRVTPERIEARLLTGDGRLRFVHIAPDGEPRVLATSGRGFGAHPTVAFSDITAGAPSRLTRAAAARLKQPPSRVRSLTYSRLVGTAQWTVHFSGGEIFYGDARGRITRRIR